MFPMMIVLVYRRCSYPFLKDQRKVVAETGKILCAGGHECQEYCASLASPAYFLKSAMIVQPYVATFCGSFGFGWRCSNRRTMHFRMTMLWKNPHLLSSVLLAFTLGGSAAAADSADTSVSAQLQQALKLFPQADTNGDGTLTMEEALVYREKVTKKAKPAANNKNRPAPTHADVAYGPHERNVLDLWIAPSDQPTPLVVYIHGGGFVGGDKSGANAWAIKNCLDAGVSFMSINYRFMQHAAIQDILRDSARAIQFIRLNAAQYRIDPLRIASFGGSAGAGTSLWLAVHDDLADPENADPVLRQSSRIAAAGCMYTQASYDVTEWEKLIGKSKPEWAHASDEDLWFYRFKNRDELTTPAGEKILADCSMIRQITKDDAPLVMTNRNPSTEPKNRGDFLHHPKHTTVVHERCKEIGVPCEVHLEDTKLDRNGEMGKVIAFLIKHLGVASSESD